MTKNEPVIVFCDGGSRGNPGPSALGAVILNQDNEVIEEIGKYLVYNGVCQSVVFAVNVRKS